MANGNSGDHPLTDILVHNTQVYGREADDLIRQIAELCSRRELDDWWEREIGWSPQLDSIISKAQLRLNELLGRASQGGWELPGSLVTSTDCGQAFDGAVAP